MYTLRTSNSKDAEFAYDVVKTTMREYAIQTWGTWLDKESKNAAIEDTAQGKIQIIYIDDEKAGTLQYEKNEDHILINQIYLLPPFQNIGVGRSILNDLKDMSKETNVPLRLSVLQVNPAKKFYTKNEFTIERETQERVFMQYAPNKRMQAYAAKPRR
jgi:GNAT superfamily N-acetyltransferase